MSAYYSRYNLNTYKNTPYFEAHIPDGYELGAVLAKSRAFRRLPNNLKELAMLSKQWETTHGRVDTHISQYYDDEGYELDLETGNRLTDEEIDAQWDDSPILDKFHIEDIPVPSGGFPDPDTWVKPTADSADQTKEREKTLLGMIANRGREYVAHDAGVSLDGVFTDKALAQKILDNWGS